MPSILVPSGERALGWRGEKLGKSISAQASRTSAPIDPHSMSATGTCLDAASIVVDVRSNNPEWGPELTPLHKNFASVAGLGFRGS